MPQVIDSGIIKYASTGGAIAPTGPVPPTQFWPGYVNSFSGLMYWWPSSDPSTTSYNVYQGASQIALGVTYQNSGGTNQLTFVPGVQSAALSAATTYNFYVTSVGPSGEGAKSAAFVITTLAATATSPTIPIATTLFTSPYVVPTGNVWTATVLTGEGGPGFGTAGTGTGNRTNCGVQYAMDWATYGDRIDVTAGADYVSSGGNGYVATLLRADGSSRGTFTGANQIYIQTTGIARLPAYAPRAIGNWCDAPTYGSHMANIQFSVSNNGYGLTFGIGAVGWRVVGVNLVPTSGFNYYALNVGINGGYNNSGTYLNPAPCQNITLDRCTWGQDTSSYPAGFVYLLHGFGANCQYFSVTQSYSWGVVAPGITSPGEYGDSNNFVQQAGPTQFLGNYLSAGSEDLMFGGGQINQGYNPQDAEITYNYFARPATWANNLCGTFTKPLLELKCLNRSVIHDNEYEENWVGGIGGYYGRAIGCGARDQNAGPGGYPLNETCPWANITDIDIYNEQTGPVMQGVGIFGSCDYGATSYVARVRVRNMSSWLHQISGTSILYGGLTDGNCWGIELEGQISDLIVDHTIMPIDNTSFSSNTEDVGVRLTQAGTFYAPNNVDRSVIRNSFLDGHPAYSGSAFGGDSAGPSNTISMYFTNSTIENNVQINDYKTLAGGGAGNTVSGEDNSAPGYASLGLTNSTGMPSSTNPLGTLDWYVTSGAYATGATDGGPIGVRQAATPVFSPPAGTYGSAQTVTITSTTVPTTPTGLIYYTLDGSTPTANSASITNGGTVSVSSNLTLNAVAAPVAWTPSAMASGAYVV